MKLYKENKDKIWWLLCFISITTGIFYNVLLGLIGCLLIGIHFYISLDEDIDAGFTETDRLGVSFVAIIAHIILYLSIIAIVASVVDKKEFKTFKQFNIKYMENEKIVIFDNNDIQILEDAKLYWECRAKSCTSIIKTTINEEVSNSIFSKNLPCKVSIEYSVGN